MQQPLKSTDYGMHIAQLKRHVREFLRDAQVLSKRMLVFSSGPVNQMAACWTSGMQRQAGTVGATVRHRRPGGSC